MVECVSYTPRAITQKMFAVDRDRHAQGFDRVLHKVGDQVSRPLLVLEPLSCTYLEKASVALRMRAGGDAV
jgi:hypothetical protein